MKLFSTLTPFLLVKSAIGQSCPSDLTSSETLTSTLTFYYAVVLASTPDERSILCGRLERQSEGWIGFAVSTSEEMIGAEAIVGRPDDGSVLKYYMTGKSVDTVTPMSDDKQTLMDTSIVQENGMTTLTFTKYLEETDEIPILSNGENMFLYAAAADNTWDYHGGERGAFTLDFMMDSGATGTSSTGAATTSAPSASVAMTPSTPASNGTTPSTNSTVPSANGTVPSANGTVPSANGTVPSANGTVPSANGTASRMNGTQPTYAPTPEGGAPAGEPPATEPAPATAPATSGSSLRVMGHLMLGAVGLAAFYIMH